MSIKDLEDEIAQIETIKKRCKPGSLQWNNIDTIIAEKKKELGRLKNPDTCELDTVPRHCTVDCSSCGR